MRGKGGVRQHQTIIDYGLRNNENSLHYRWLYDGFHVVLSLSPSNQNLAIPVSMVKYAGIPLISPWVLSFSEAVIVRSRIVANRESKGIPSSERNHFRSRGQKAISVLRPIVTRALHCWKRCSSTRPLSQYNPAPAASHRFNVRMRFVCKIRKVHQAPWGDATRCAHRTKETTVGRGGGGDIFRSFQRDSPRSRVKGDNLSDADCARNIRHRRPSRSRGASLFLDGDV